MHSNCVDHQITEQQPYDRFNSSSSKNITGESNHTDDGDDHHSVQVPVPVCITLYHLLPPPSPLHHRPNDEERIAAANDEDVIHLDEMNSDDDEIKNNHKNHNMSHEDMPMDDHRSEYYRKQPPRWYRLPEHSKKLLRHFVLLEIFQGDSVIYSSLQNNNHNIHNHSHPTSPSITSIHPSWDLIHEKIQWKPMPVHRDKDHPSTPFHQGNVVTECHTNSLQRNGLTTTIPVTVKDDNHNALDWTADAYQSMSIRVSLITGRGDGDTEVPDVERSTCSSTSSRNRSPVMVLAESPLHPSFLQLLAPVLSSSLSSWSDDEVHSSSSQLEPTYGSNHRLLPLSLLPPNSLVIYFSDGNIRISNHLYQILFDHGIVMMHDSHQTSDGKNQTTTTISETGRITKLQMLKESSTATATFSDDVFAKLDQVTTTGTAAAAATKIALVPETTLSLVNHGTNQRIPRVDISLLEASQDDNEVEPNLMVAETSHDFPSIRRLEACTNHDGNTYSHKREDNTTALPPSTGWNGDCCRDHNDSLPSITLITLHDLQHEQQQLQLQLEEEQSALDQDIESLQQDKEELHRLITRTQAIRNETQQIRKTMLMQPFQQQVHYFLEHGGGLLCGQRQAELEVEAHRIKLITELRTLYPIQAKSEQRYMIRGLELPRDVHSAIVSEDEISAALGYLTHLVGMMSKYLSIPLRYRMYCSSSRSAISQDVSSSSATNAKNTPSSSAALGVGAVFPLFTNRAVERDELDRGLCFLHSNVDCLLETRDIHCAPQTHILAKIQRIYDKIIDGC